MYILCVYHADTEVERGILEESDTEGETTKKPELTTSNCCIFMK